MLFFLISWMADPPSCLLAGLWCWPCFRRYCSRAGSGPCNDDTLPEPFFITFESSGAVYLVMFGCLRHLSTFSQQVLAVSHMASEASSASSQCFRVWPPLPEEWQALRTFLDVIENVQSSDILRILHRAYNYLQSPSLAAYSASGASYAASGSGCWCSGCCSHLFRKCCCSFRKGYRAPLMLRLSLMAFFIEPGVCFLDYSRCLCCYSESRCCCFQCCGRLFRSCCCNIRREGQVSLLHG